jgi:hypothetical protein
MSSMEVADTILAQIRAKDYWALGAWGAHTFMGDENSVTFQVRGAKSGHAYVKITLEPDDTYTVDVFKVRRVKTEIRRTEIGLVEDVYWDMLVPVIDGIMEGRRR